MTDEGAFERLSLAALRRWLPDGEALIHEGVNAEGKPVPAPVDGFGIVPGSNPPRCVLVACTTTARSGLRRKWLFDHLNPESHSAKQDPRSRAPKPLGVADDGDLIKAIRVAAKTKVTLPTARFKIYLVTNRSGVGDLMTKIEAVSQAAGVETEIVDATRLADFLDFNPAGQWVRFHFFGSPILHVSSDLLKDASKSSICQRQAGEEFNTARRLVVRESSWLVRESLATPSVGLIWLSAQPGKGKSVLALQEASAHIAEGEFALWLPERDIQEAGRLGEAIDTVLSRQYANLDSSGVGIIGATGASGRLLLLVDDLNRLESPEPTFRKLRSWIREIHQRNSQDKDGSPSEFSCVVLCPIWPQHFDTLRRTLAGDSLASWERVVDLPNLSESELRSVFEGTAPTAAEQQSVGLELGRDPLLCAVYADELRTNRDAHVTPKGVLERYVRRQLDSVSSVSGHPPSEYREALEQLGRAMLQGKNLRPSWTMVRSWFTQDETASERLRELVQARKVLHLEADSEVVLFTHDRFLTAICASCIPQLLNDHDLIEDPFFAEIIGRALAAGQFDSDLINTVLEQNPLAAFFALQFCEADDLKALIGTTLEAWAKAHRSDATLPEGLWWEITRVLVKTDARIVVELANKLPPNWHLYLAALRNGSAIAGVKYCITAGRGWFLPALQDSHRNEIIGHAVERRGVRLAAELNSFLGQPHLDPAGRAAALVLAGFLGLRDLESGIDACWRNTPPAERSKVIAEMLWALARCKRDDVPQSFHEVLTEWERMPSPREDLIDSIAFDALGHCPPTWLSDVYVGKLIEMMPQFPRLLPSLEHVITCIDTPTAFEFQVRKLSQGMRKGSTQYLGLALTMSRWDRRNMGEHMMSTQSRARLLLIWSDSNEPKEDREAAFALWLLSATTEDLPVLRSISSENVLYGRALRQRVQLRDKTATNEIADRLSGDWSLLHDVPAIWSSALLAPVTETFAMNGTRIFYSGRGTAFILSIPATHADALIESLWGTFGNETGLQTAALLLGSPSSKTLVAAHLTTRETCDPVLQHARFLMMTSEPYISTDEHISFWLNQCVPYLRSASQETLRGFVMLCRSTKTWRWYQEEVAPYLLPESQTESDERLDLVNVERQWRTWGDLNYGAQRFFEELDERGVDRRDTLQRIAADADADPTVQNVSWLAACIVVAGERKDLSLLDGFESALEANVIHKLQVDSRFAVRRRTLD